MSYGQEVLAHYMELVDENDNEDKEENELVKQLEQIYQDFGDIADKMESVIESIGNLYRECYNLSEIEKVLMDNFSSDMNECRAIVINTYEKYVKLADMIKVANEE